MKAILKSEYRYNTATLLSGKGFSKNHPTELPDEMMAEVQEHPWLEVYIEPKAQKSDATSISGMTVADAIRYIKTFENRAVLIALRDEEMAGKARAGVLRCFDQFDLEPEDLDEDQAEDLDEDQAEDLDEEEIEVVE